LEKTLPAKADPNRTKHYFPYILVLPVMAEIGQ